MHLEVAGTNLPSSILEITRKRLWFLYCVVGMIKREIEELTGWSRSQIDSRLRRWNLTMWSETSIETQFRIEEAIARHLGAPAIDILLHPEGIQDTRRDLQARMRAALESGTIDWGAIDACHSPPSWSHRSSG